MGDSNRMQIEAALVRHYASQRAEAAEDDIAGLVGLMLAEDSRCARTGGRGMGAATFVAAQARFIPTWTWAAQLACVAAMVWIALALGDSEPVRWFVGIMAALSVLVCVPTLHASRRYGVAELEYSCRFDTLRVLAARLVVMGCSCSAAVALMIVGTSAVTGLGAFALALWTCPPYFLACAGSLALMRRMGPHSAPVACVGWVAACCGTLLAFGHAFPDAYTLSSLGTWALAAVAALVWLVREVSLTVCAAAAGLDAFAPHLANANN